MFTKELLIRGEVDAIDLVVRDVAVNPLDIGSQLIEDLAGRGGCRVQLFSAEPPDS